MKGEKNKRKCSVITERINYHGLIIEICRKAEWRFMSLTSRPFRPLSKKKEKENAKASVAAPR